MTTPNIASETTQSSQIIDLQVWKTIKLGIKESYLEYYRAIKESVNGTIEPYAAFLLNRLELEINDGEQDLVVLGSEILGFKTLPTMQEVLSRAQELGLELCSEETSLALCLQWCGAEWIGKAYLGMKPINFGSEIGVFFISMDTYIRRESHCGYVTDLMRLDARISYPETPFDPESQWIFVKHRKQEAAT